MSTPIKPETTPPVLQKRSRALTGWILLAVAVLAGLGAAFLAVRTLNSQESALKQRLLSELSRKEERTVAAVVPIQNLPPNTVLTLSMVARRSIPAETAPGDVVLDTDFNKIEHKRLLFPAERGKPLTLSMFSSVKSPADMLDGNHLALTISVDTENSIDKMLRPGDHIDMLWIAKPPANGGGAVRFLEQNLQVLATGRDLSPNGGKADENAATYGTITLAVTPLQAQKILIAQKSGEIRLDLRSNDKEGAWPNRTLTLQDIMGVIRTSAGIEYIIGGSSNRGIPQIARVVAVGATQPLTRTAGSNPPSDNTATSSTADGNRVPEVRYLPFSYSPPMTQP
ncbi:Flp pilus assembly protein CpaB [Acidithiobacillus sp.]